jgi:hypothetical protein
MICVCVYRIEQESEHDFRPQRKLFKELERFKREAMAALQHKAKEHDDRIRTLEINYEEFRASNDREHEDFAKGIGSCRTGNSQNGSEIKSIWDELKRCVSACQNIPAALHPNLVAQ